MIIEPYAVVNSPNVIIEDMWSLNPMPISMAIPLLEKGRHLSLSKHRNQNPRSQIPRRKNLRENRQKLRIREFVTINSSCQENSVVEIGDSCLIMAYCHVAHNCIVGNRVIMSNNATLAGHVTVEDCAIIGGMTPIHQFVRIGRYAMVGGMSRVTHDIPPYTIGAGIPYKFGGLNIIGLKRHGFPLETRRELSKAFKLLYRSQVVSGRSSQAH